MELFNSIKIIFFIIAFIGFGVVIVLALFLGKMQEKRRAKKMLSDEAIAEQINEELERKDFPLEKWEPKVIHRLTFVRFDATARSGFFNKKGQGYVVDKFDKRYIKYAYSGNKRQDYNQITAVVNTSDFQIEMKYEKSGFKMYVDNQYLGSYELKKEVGYIYDENNKTIGKLTRRRGRISINEIDLFFKIVRLYYKNTHQHHLLELSNGLQGELTNRRTEPMRTEVFKLNKMPSKVQEKWLLALLLFEVTYHQEQYIRDHPYYDS